MKLSVPHGETILTTKYFYVTSDSDPKDTHIVTYAMHTYFCDCRDFMIRHLPDIGNPKFELCKHGKLVQSNTIPAVSAKQPTAPWGTQVRGPLKYGIFYFGSSGVFRSGDADGTYDTRDQAKKALEQFKKDYPQPRSDRRVRAFYSSNPETPVSVYGVFRLSPVDGYVRSSDVRGEFVSKEAAEQAIQDHNKMHGGELIKRYVREIE